MNLKQFFTLRKSEKALQPTGVLANKIIRRSISRSKRDIADWKQAERRAKATEDPRFYPIQDLYDEISNDALLSSQINNRVLQTIAAPFELTNQDGTVNDEATAMLSSMPAIPTIIQAILEARYFGYSLVELQNTASMLHAINLPRRNIDPVFGRFFPDATAPNFIKYREMSEFGKYILEFNQENLGLLNKTVPHVLFKKFAQSCWSELCEIYGIPPRYLKTNTTDPEMLARGEQMMRDMGTAAAFVIDSSEEFSFATGVSTNGEVYRSLISLCNQEISMLISGAIIGQDTENGNYSKEQSSREVLDQLILADQRVVEQYMNGIVLPALNVIGAIKTNTLQFRFSATEDTSELWEKVREVLPYKEVDSEWMTEKFGIPVSDKLPAMGESKESLSFFV